MQTNMLRLLQNCKSFFQSAKFINLDSSTRIKADHVKLSLDYLAPNDLEMASNVVASVDVVREIFFHSDKCGSREQQKVLDEYDKDLKKLRFKTRVSIWKFIKEVNSSGASKEKKEDGEDG